MSKRPTQRPRKWSAKKRAPKTGRTLRRSALVSPFQQPDGPRHDSDPRRGE